MNGPSSRRNRHSRCRPSTERPDDRTCAPRAQPPAKLSTQMGPRCMKSRRRSASKRRVSRRQVSDSMHLITRGCSQTSPQAHRSAEVRPNNVWLPSWRLARLVSGAPGRRGRIAKRPKRRTLLGGFRRCLAELPYGAPVIDCPAIEQFPFSSIASSAASCSSSPNSIVAASATC